MLKLTAFFTNVFTTIEHSSSFLAGNYTFVLIMNWLQRLGNFLLSLLWTVCRFFFGLMEALEYMIHRFLGIGSTLNDFTKFSGDLIVTYKDEFGNDVIRPHLDVFVDTFKAVAGVSFILLIVFTIFAIIRQEWNTYSTGYESDKKGPSNDKVNIIMRLFRNIIIIIAMPITLMLIVSGVNAVLTSFNNAINVNQGLSVSGQVLAVSTYDSNKYRNYAMANQRVPIIISVYDTSDIDPDEISDLKNDIASLGVQNELKITATNLANRTFASFKDSLIYKNNKFTNSSSYGKFYEKFVATAEQYHVMADFVDYMQKKNINFYIKSMDDVEIEWKYVNDVVYVREDNELNISYKDASGYEENKNFYTMTLAPSTEITTPISDALDSIMAMLGVGEYGENNFKVMERDDSGEFVNLVNWANEKALIKFSDAFNVDIPSTWTDSDEIIFYEYYHFSSNNTFGTATLDDLKKGVEMDVNEIVYRNYYPEADAYSPNKYMYVVLINGTYYRVEPSTSLTDSYGDPYYILSSLNNWSITNKNVHFLDPDYTILTKTADTVELKLSENFDINKPYNVNQTTGEKTSNWKISDQILVYEYYKDLTVGNDFSKYSFAKFYDGVTLPVYEISDMEAVMNTETGEIISYPNQSTVTKPYVLINGTFYELIESSSVYSLATTAGQNFLVEPEKANPTFYNYTVLIDTAENSSGFNTTFSTAESFIYTPNNLTLSPIPLAATDPDYAKYSNFHLQLSENFDYTDVSTWSYRDYFIFYLYTTYDIAANLDYLKYVGIPGSLVTLEGGKFFKTDELATINGSRTRPLYIKLDANNISELNLTQKIDTINTLESNDYGTLDSDLFISFDKLNGDKLFLTEIQSQNFKLSEGYFADDVTTWTVSDLILSYFSSLGVINSISDIETHGYESFVYEVQREVSYVANGTTSTKVVTDKLYRFGNAYASATSERTYYLSEYNVLNYIYDSTGTNVIRYLSLNEWLNKNVLDFICQINELDTSDIFNTYDELVDNLYTDYESYILDFDELVSKMVSENWNEDLNSIVNYTYTNPNFVSDDLSTWTQFDLLINYISGSSNGSFTTNVILGNDDKQYIVVGDYAINITDEGLFKMSLSDNSTISSSAATIVAFATNDLGIVNQNTTVEEYVESVLLGSVLIENERLPSDLDYFTSLKFYYEASNNNLTKTTKVIDIVGTVYDLDTIIAYCEGNVSALGDYYYNIFTDGLNYYLRINDSYSVQIFREGNGLGEHVLSFNYKPTLNLEGNGRNSIFTLSSEYDAFELYTHDGNDKKQKVNKLDSIVFALTSDSSQRTFKVYHSAADNKSYIAVHVGRAVKFIEYSSLLDYNYTIPNTIPFITAKQHIDFLYNNYYASLFHTTLPNDIRETDTDELSKKTVKYVTPFDVENMLTWTPLSIILYKQGILWDDYDGTGLDPFTVYISNDGTKTYLQTILIKNNETTRVYIDVTDICFIASTDGNNPIYECTLDAISKLYLRLFFTVNVSDGVSLYDANYNHLNVLNSHSISFRRDFLDTKYGSMKIDLNNKKTDIYLPYYDENVEPYINKGLDINNPETWSWFDLLYYNVFKEVRTESKFLQYVSGDSTANRYVYLMLVDDASEKHLYTYKVPGQAGTSALTTRFTEVADADKIEVDVKGSDNEPETVLEMIYRKLTNGPTTSSEKIDEFKYKPKGLATEKSFYYIQSYYDNQFYGVYNFPANFETVSLKVLKNDCNINADASYISAPIEPGFYESVGSEALEILLYATSNQDDVYNWNILDFIIYYTTAASESKTYASNLYTYNDNFYICIGEYYVNLTAFDGLITIDNSAGIADGTISVSQKLIDQVGISNLSRPAADPAEREKVLIGHRDLGTSGVANEKQLVENINNESIGNASLGLGVTHNGQPSGELIVNASNIYPELLAFSNGFKPNDLSTWTVSDFLIYYAFDNGYFADTGAITDDGLFDVLIKYTAIEDGSRVQRAKTLNYSTTNFQYFLNNGGAPAFVYSMQKADEYGNVTTYKVLNIGNNVESNKVISEVTGETSYFDYEVFMQFYGRKLMDVVSIDRQNASFVLGHQEVNDINNGEFTYRIDSLDEIVDFIYENYYFFNYNTENFDKFGTDEGINESLPSKIQQQEVATNGIINLKLSDDFELTDVSTWTLLDYIIIYEYSRSVFSLNFEDTSANANLFYNLQYSELANPNFNNYVPLYTDDSGVVKILSINGNLYNLTEYLTEQNPEIVNYLSHFIDSLTSYTSGSLSEHLKTTLSAYTQYTEESYGKHLIDELSSYTDPAENVGYALLCKLIEITSGYLNQTGIQSNHKALAEYMNIILNQLIESTLLEEEPLKDHILAKLTSYHQNLQEESEFKVSDSVKVNSYNRTVPKLDGDGNVEVDGDGNQLTETLAISGVVSFNDATVGSYGFKILVEKVNFAISRVFDESREIEQTNDTISYQKPADGDNVRYYRGIYNNTKAAYQIKLTDLPSYEISKMVKEVSWPEKLMNDMQVLYPDLNWGTLIATDGWLDTLGDYTSAYTNGLFETSGNSANTTAAGLVLSELFLSVANNIPSEYANFEYTSLFDQDVIQSLMLSLLGEEEFKNLKLQAEVFMEMFNTSFAPILEDIAREKSVSIVDGQVDNFVMCVYKSFLATVLLSSDLGEYLYTVATRVYAEYTIFESLACASGDYAGYYAFVNGYTDENGDTVDAFKFSTFYELVKYENELSGNSTPMFTFNMFNVYKYYKQQEDTNLTNIEIRTLYNEEIAADGHSAVYKKLFDKLDAHYNSTISRGERVPDNSPLYCYMLEVYWSIYHKIPNDGLFGTKKIPDYLTVYRSYLTGGIKRWGIVDEVSIINAQKFLAKRGQYESTMFTSKISYVFDLIGMYTYQQFDNIEDMEKLEAFLSKLNIFDNDAFTNPKNILRASFGSKYQEKLDLLLKYNPFELMFTKHIFDDSENGDYGAWNHLLKVYEELPLMIDEIYEIISISIDDNTGNNHTESYSVKVYEDYIYEECIEVLDKIYMDISDYVNAQQSIDQITKYSITFALSQYGQNYVTTGYNFNIENKNYTFNSYLSAQRLAEYVYGGQYLQQFGVEPVYTSSDYKGIVSQSKIYDAVQGEMNISLGMWTELRKFASEIANYTAKLYYTTNLSDLPQVKNDGVNMTDYVYGKVSGSVSSKTSEKTTPEYLILDYLMRKEKISADTFVRLIFADKSARIEAIYDGDSEHTNDVWSLINYNNMLNMAKYLEMDTNNPARPVMGDAQKLNAVIDYLVFIQSDLYSYGAYNETGNIPVNERIHKIFKNVITYLIVSEEQSEEQKENQNDIIESVETTFVSLDDLTFQEFKLLLMERLVDYEENPSETTKENSNRYLALFNLISGQLNFNELSFNGTNPVDGKSIGTIIKPSYLEVYEVPETPSPSEIEREGVLVYVKDMSSGIYVKAEFKIDKPTRDSILKMAGLSNRPIEELIGLEYDSLYDRNGYYDEAMGDVFIVCTLDNSTGKYIPVLARGKETKLIDFNETYSAYIEYVDTYGIDLQTEYYDTGETFIDEYDADADDTVEQYTNPAAYPIIAKGVISSQGYPTGIRMQDGVVSFYRTNLTASYYISEDAVSATAQVSQVSTVGYTDYVESTSHEKVSGSESKTMFVGSYDLKTYLSSDAGIYLLQDEMMYTLPPVDDFGGMSVLDQFSAFFELNFQSYFLLLMGISVMFPLLYSSSAAVLRRVFDLMFLTLISPAVIAMRSLDTKDDDKKGVGMNAFNNWKLYLEKSLLSAFGFIIGFNIYYILVQSTIGLTFVTNETMASIVRIGGLDFISKSLLEALLKFVYIIAAAGLVREGGKLLLGIVTAGKVTNHLASPLDAKGNEVIDQIKAPINEAKSALTKVEGIVTGQALLDMKDAAIEGALSAIPGKAYIDGIAEKIEDKNAEKKAEEMAQKAQASGVAKEAAEKAAKELCKQELEMKRQKKKDRIEGANRFMSTYMDGMMKFSDEKFTMLDTFMGGLALGTESYDERKKRLAAEKKKNKKKK